MVNKMVTLGTAFGDIEDELESMLDIVSEALDLMDDNKDDEAAKLLLDLENKLLDFLDYEEVDESVEDIVLAETIQAKVPSKQQPKQSNKPKSSSKPKSKR